MGEQSGSKVVGIHALAEQRLRAFEFGAAVSVDDEFDNPRVRASWAATFDCAVTAHQLCQMDHEQVESFTRELIAMAGGTQEIEDLYVHLAEKQARALERTQAILREGAERMAVGLKRVRLKGR